MRRQELLQAQHLLVQPVQDEAQVLLSVLLPALWGADRHTRSATSVYSLQDTLLLHLQPMPSLEALPRPHERTPTSWLSSLENWDPGDRREGVKCKEHFSPRGASATFILVLLITSSNTSHNHYLNTEKNNVKGWCGMATEGEFKSRLLCFQSDACNMPAKAAR